MAKQFWASCLFPLFLAALSQSTLNPQKTKVDCDKGVAGTIYEYGAKTLNGGEYVQFQQYAGKHILFVNVASFCGLTATYPELNTLQEELRQFNVVVLGFPCNQFGKQEPAKNSEILHGLKYVRPGGGYVPNFQLFEKGDVNGENEQKFFSFLKSGEDTDLAKRECQRRRTTVCYNCRRRPGKKNLPNKDRAVTGSQRMGCRTKLSLWIFPLSHSKLKQKIYLLNINVNYLFQ
ncbi:glutathione peroxidase 6 isoform X1 [Peromyscus maniculatus bairdii]|uniref:glutathione peroxidase 6 isoform X1 n=1 Tax=Peromyscus maniculatus bairdii TaxID=230844 RepID=UPI003FD07715